MKIFLIDFENVKSKGLEGIDKLEETDSVIIFFSENSDTLSFEMHQKVLSSKADIEYFKVSVGGKNALDFQLSTLLGFMVAKEIYSHIFVISNDKGFDFLHSFWCGNYIDTPSTLVYRSKTISGAVELEKSLKKSEEAKAKKAEKAVVQTEETAVEEIVEQPVEAAAEEAAEEAVKPEAPKKKKAPAKKAQSFDEMFTGLISGACSESEYDRIKELMVASETKEEFHNSLAKIYKQQGTEIYKALKTRYLRLKEKYAAQQQEQTEQTEQVQTQPKEEVVEIEVSDRLSELLSEVCTQPEDIERVRSCINSTKNKKQLYISMVKEFQKKKGCEYYNALKPYYSELSKQTQEC